MLKKCVHAVTISALSLLLLSAKSLLASPEWLAFDGGLAKRSASPGARPALDLRDKGANGVEIEFSFPGAWLNKQKVNGVHYRHIGITGFGRIGIPGRPALPQRVVWIALPRGAQPRLRILSQQSRTVPGHIIHPALQDASDEEGEAEPEFELDSAFYSRDAQFPERVARILEIRKFRAASMALVGLYPVQYNPAKQELSVTSHMRLAIEFEGAQEAAEPVGRRQLSLVKNLALNNPSFLQPDEEAAGDDFAGLLILTVNEYREAADSLAVWKRQMGYDVYVSSRSSWADSQVVKDTIHGYASDKSIDFFCIIGDEPDVPMEMHLRNSSSDTSSSRPHVTDLYYACVDDPDDWKTPDLGFGRISVSNANEALRVIRKIVNYERDPVDDENFYNHALVAAYYQDNDPKDTYADRRFLQTSWEMRNYLLQHGYDVERVYYTKSDATPLYWNKTNYSTGGAMPDSLKRSNFSWNGNGGDIRNGLNSGRFLLTHRDHGKQTRWSDPRFTTTDIGQLTNGDKLPVVFSLNCQTGRFNHATSACFAEVFLRKENGGAVGVVAATQTSYSGYNDALAAGMIDAVWPEPGLVPDFKKTSPAQQSHDPIFEMGLVVAQGKLRVSSTYCAAMNYHNSEKHTYELFHWHGDPTMKIWTAPPQTITAQHSANIGHTQSSFTISNLACDQGCATLWYDGEIIGKDEFSRGTSSIDVLSNPDLGEEVLLTVTSHNFRPYRRTLDVTQTTGVSAPSVSASTGFAIPILDIAGFAKRLDVELYSINGTLIATLHSGRLHKQHTVLPAHLFSAARLGIASGAYIVRIATPAYTQAVRLILN
ncbi:MAG: hypothetical protein GF398_17590 [Chitinivibrionales bacterium]|nr:hypothetical protein [Chitinivibrionales bacterium]